MAMARECEEYEAGVFAHAHADGTLLLDAVKCVMWLFQVSGGPCVFLFRALRSTCHGARRYGRFRLCCIGRLVLSSGHVFDKAEMMATSCLYKAVAAVEGALSAATDLVQPFLH